ncbi:sensor histidine kinase [Ruminococcus sp. AF31-8BH]|uniref:sensor histidine kinase n=1 Tax=Ruminococcus sp. AF31-8BH TaxID=2293174 RepID=UPI000E526EB4|nr:sensor histidine kinase [Ruminococcus sp. AF31-8BH]RGF78075.1 sensor histidine kinase [Ruminococcus sp. AF31-8BH]
MKKKILTLAAVVTLPFILLVMYLLASMASYSNTYSEIVSNMTVANNYNLNFKEEMDESLYKLVVGYVTLDNIESDKSLKNPYVLIEELRSEFTRLTAITTESESKLWLESLLRNINALEKRVDDIVDSIDAGGRYSENIEMLDNNIYILTELIQDDIQYYIYYQTRYMEKVTDTLQKQIGRFMVVCSILIAVLIAVVAVSAVMIVSGILQPIRQLNSVTEKIAQGDFNARAQVNSDDEVAELAVSFNKMAGNMQSLIDKVKEDERKMRKADLRLLQEQIQPHFLYNTLDTIVWLIESNEPDEAVTMVVTLSDFFREILSKGKEFISIKEEEKHISSYLQIQEMRYRDILEYDIQLDQVIYKYQILKLTLQPVVENALYHGIKYKRAKGCIHIHGEKEGDIIRLTVRDDGVGMDEEELAQLRQQIEKPCQETEKGFGLANVNERIHMYFGYEYGMKIESEKGKGTTVEIVIPAILEASAENAANVQPQQEGARL